MNLIRTIWRSICSLGQQRAANREIDDELRFHVEQRTTENIAAGMSPEDAAREARKRFGNAQAIREKCRDMRGTNFGEPLFQDLRFGARMLRKNPGFTAIILLTLALGIGAVSSVFSIVQGVMWTRPPYSNPEQIVLISTVRKDGGAYVKGCTPAEWQEWRTEAKSFSEMAAYNYSKGMDFLISAGGSEPMSGLAVTLDFFKVMGVQPQLGRAFLPSDLPPPDSDYTAGPAVILGHEFWQRRFHGDTNVIGQVIRLNFNGPVTVVGVMPPGFRSLPGRSNVPRYDTDDPVDCWLPIAPERLGQMKRAVLGRLRDGARVETAQTELTVIAARQAQADHALEGITARAELLTSYMNRDVRQLLVPLSGAVALVFLIACGNVAGLLLARGLQRQQEYAVRCALGAGRWRLIRQSLAESLLLAVSGGFLGAALAVATVKVLKAMAGAAIPRLDAVTIGWPMWVCCFVAALLALVIGGLAPAFRASQLDPAAASKGGARTSASRADRRLLAAVVVTQTALTLVLLLGAGLMIRTVSKLAQIQPGYDTQRIVTMAVSELKQAQQGTAANDFLHHVIDFHQRALAQIAALPGVKSVAWVFGIPLTGDELSAVVEMDGSGHAEKFKDEIVVAVRTVSAGYLDTIGTQLLAGRNFGPADNYTNGVFRAIINQAMADRYFANRDPIGMKFRFAFRIGPETTARFKDTEIIGVAADSCDEALMQKAEPGFYLSWWQLPHPGKSLVVRTTGDPRSVVPAILQTMRALDPTVAIGKVMTFDQIRNDSIAPQLFSVRVLTGFSIVAGGLALIGVYGALSLSVASRSREMAIRMAVGAPRRSILGLILGEGLKLVGAGVVIGTAMALALTGTLRALLFGVGPTDPSTFAAVAALFMAVAALGCYFPARRATQINPMTALRYE